MRAYWILPNRDQGDAVLANDGLRSLPLRDVLDPGDRPPGFSHGVPRELLEKYGPEHQGEVLFAQRFPCGPSGEQLAAVFAPAGVDMTGRVVHIGLLFVLGKGEAPQFALSRDGLRADDRASAAALVARMRHREHADPWAESVRELFALPDVAEPTTNVELEHSATRFDALYRLGRAGLTRLGPRRPSKAAHAIVLSTFLAAAFVCASLSARHCGDASKHGEQLLQAVTVRGER
jgi:hypothetical protein